MKHIASWSGGKDSTASIILAHEHNEPLDLIIFSEVMFDKNVSGELPEHIDFIKNKCIPLFESWGYEVKILHADTTYIDCFNKIVEKPLRHILNKGKKGVFQWWDAALLIEIVNQSPYIDFIKKYQMTLFNMLVLL